MNVSILGDTVVSRLRYLAAVCLLLFLPMPAAYAATINVDDHCSLDNAISSANGVAQVGAMNSCETVTAALIRLILPTM